jgi:hypothetical protein
VFVLAAALLVLVAPLKNEHHNGSWRIREQNLQLLRSRTNKLAAAGKYAEAAESFEQGYREALALKIRSRKFIF